MNQPPTYIPETMSFTDSVFHSPISDKINMMSSQQGNVCGMFEAQYYRCLEAFGSKLGRLYCDLEYRDFRECMTHEKQLRRIEAMRKERFKQYVRGERPKHFEHYFTFGDIDPQHYQWDINPVPGKN